MKAVALKIKIMLNNDLKFFLPKHDGRALDFIKICAAIFMVVDHVGFIWFDHDFFLMMLIGRGTFPLFCYAVAIAILKANGSFPARYITRLLIFAIVAEPFYYFTFGTLEGNVIFTLAGGALMAAIADRVKLWQMYVLYIGAMMSMLMPFPIEFGLAGIMLPSAIMLMLRGEKSVFPFLILLLFFINAGNFVNDFREGVSPAVISVVFFMIGICCMVLPMMVLNFAKNFQQTGRYLSKHALYVFYPAHLFLLKIFGLVFFK